MLGESTSGWAARGEKNAGPVGTNGLMDLRFLRDPRRSYSLNDCFFGPVAVGPRLLLQIGGDLHEPAVLHEVDPVSICTTCLNEEVSACTKVVGYGVVSIVLGTAGLGFGFGVVGCGCGGADPEPDPLAVEEPLLVLLPEEEVEEELGDAGRVNGFLAE